MVHHVNLPRFLGRRRSNYARRWRGQKTRRAGRSACDDASTRHAEQGRVPGQFQQGTPGGRGGAPRSRKRNIISQALRASSPVSTSSPTSMNQRASGLTLSWYSATDGSDPSARAITNRIRTANPPTVLVNDSPHGLFQVNAEGGRGAPSAGALSPIRLRRRRRRIARASASAPPPRSSCPRPRRRSTPRCPRTSGTRHAPSPETLTESR